MKRLVLFFMLLFSISFYGQNDTISVVRHTDNDLVIPKNARVVFRGLLNELFIDVPNSKSFEVSGNGITKIDKNTYNLNPGSGTETVVNIDIVLNNNEKVNEKYIFKMRSVPNAISTINNQQGLVKLNKTLLENSVINVSIPDKNVDLGIVITSFYLKIPRENEIEIIGNKIDSKTYNIISKKLSKHDKITIFDIRFTKKIRGNLCGIPPIVIEIL